MNDELLQIFKAEAREYLISLNDNLLQLELSEGDNRQNLLKEMNRTAHSMRGAARAVDFSKIEVVSQYLEEIFNRAMSGTLIITPGMGDTLYDGLDVVQHRLNGNTLNTAIEDEILSNLEGILSGERTPDENNLLKTDSAEIQIITDEISVIGETEKTYLAPQQISAHVSDELLKIFYTEVEDYLKVLNQSLINVEMTTGEERTRLLNEMNRIAHSMKGAAHGVGNTVIETISHYAEEFFQKTLEGELAITPNIADVLYDGFDIIKETVSGREVDSDIFTAVIQQLSQITGQRIRKNDVPLQGTATVPPAEETPEMEIPLALVTSSIETMASPTLQVRASEETIRVSVSKLNTIMADTSELLISKLQGENRRGRLNTLYLEHLKWQREWRNVRSVYSSLVRNLQDNQENISPEMEELLHFLEINESYLTHSNRELAHLNQLMLQDNMQLTTLANQLQDNTSDLRMMPFETVIGGFQRIARDIARAVGKKLHLEFNGVSVELDKSVLDALKDPMMHLLRNAIDHGLETSEERLKIGKPPIGHVSISVEQRGSEIIITVKDDGRGFNVSQIRQKAIERHIITEEEAYHLSDKDIQLLVFHPGFTTSQEVTAVSGRGLGMDIVRNRVESLRGDIRIDSFPHQGATVTLIVPVSLTRLRAVIFRCGDERYAIAANRIERMETISTDAIYSAEDHELFNLNGRPTQLVSLGRLLDVPNIDKRDTTVNIITLSTTERAIAFEIDAFSNEVEIVLKPLGRELINTEFVAGATLLGSGEAIVVLDASQLVRYVNSYTGNLKKVANTHAQNPQNKVPCILIVDDSITTRTLEKNILDAAGFDVHVAIDGSEAWHKIPELQPDIVVSDIEMPKMNGLELTKQMKGSSQTKHIPIILLTSLGRPEQREAGLNAGANAYLVKSQFDQGELIETIQQLI